MNVFSSLLKLLFPNKEITVIAVVLESLLGALAKYVDQMEAYRDMTGPEKMAYVVKQTSGLASSVLEKVPFWSTMEEEAKERIISGLAETALQIHRAKTIGNVKPKEIKKAFKEGIEEWLVVPS